MIDLNRLRKDIDTIKPLIQRKEPSFDIDALVSTDVSLRQHQIDVEALRKEKKELAAKGAQGLTPALREQAIEVGKKLKEKELALELIEKEFKELYLACPNIPDSDLPEGNKEENLMVKSHGSKPMFNFEPKHHLELNEQHQWFDLEIAGKMSGAQFVLYKSPGAKMIYALTHMMLKNNAAHGFDPIVPPVLVRDQALYNSGNLPKFEGDFYRVNDDGLCLIPTAEVSLTNMYVDTIFSADELPVRNTAWTSCFRREAGTYGSLERGLIRIHQFEKVELYSLCKPEDSAQELDRMIACAESILQKLDLHYRIMLLAGQDCSFSSARTYDIEVWLPGQNRYYEVSSCSNCTDFQARRAGIRYRPTADSKPQPVHTLNASSLALPRLMVALIENNQQADGTIALPSSLKEIMSILW